MISSPLTTHPLLHQVHSHKLKYNSGGSPKSLLSLVLSPSNKYGCGLPTSRFAKSSRTCANHRNTKSYAALKHIILRPPSLSSMCTSLPSRGLTSEPFHIPLVSLVTPYLYASPAPPDLLHNAAHPLIQHPSRLPAAFIPTSAPLPD